MLAVSFLVRLALFPLKGYPIDTNDFLAWFNTRQQRHKNILHAIDSRMDRLPAV